MGIGKMVPGGVAKNISEKIAKIFGVHKIITIPLLNQ
jgi:hypothetical protein